MSAKSNTIRTRADWDAQRERAASDPGRFHGEIASSEIHWFHSGRWIKRVNGRWTVLNPISKKREAAPDLADSFVPWIRGLNADMAPFYKWFEGAHTNACFNEVDAHVIEGFGAEFAFHFEGEEWDSKLNGGLGGSVKCRSVTRRRLLLETARYALALRSLGLKTGDRVIFNMPNIPEQIFLIEAAKRLGIIYCPVFGGFSAKTLSDRIQNAGARVLFTTDGLWKNGAVSRCKEDIADFAVEHFIPAQDVRALFATSSGAFRQALDELLNGEITVDRDLVKKVIETHVTDGSARLTLLQDLSKLQLTCERVVTVPHLALPDVPMADGRDVWLTELLRGADAELAAANGGADPQELGDGPLVDLVYKVVPPVAVESSFPLFIMYTSGSTGKPKGIVHTHGGYVSGVAHTMRVSFDVAPGDGKVMLVLADPGWITGQSYMISAPLVMRTTSILLEGSPVFPTAGRFASVIERYQVNILKAGSTFLKAVAADSKNIEEVKAFNVSSLDVATFCAEPTSPSIQEFGMRHLTPNYINSYWATEHGGMVLTHFYGNADFPLRADTHTRPLPWIFAEVWISENGNSPNGWSRRIPEAGEKGELVITRPYPYLALTIWGDGDRVLQPSWRGDLDRFKETYFAKWDRSSCGGTWAYTQGDFACSFEDGSFTLHGRSDDVINTSGHRIGTEEIEGAILQERFTNPSSPVANAIVVGCPHPEKGTVPVAFLLLKKGTELTPKDSASLIKAVATGKGEHAIPAGFIVLSEFPETRSGKYMRRLLSAILADEPLGDLSTLKNPGAIGEIRERAKAWQATQATLSAADLADEGELTKLIQSVRPEDMIAELKSYLGDRIARLLTLRELDLGAPLRDLGLTSLRALQFANFLKHALGPANGSMITPTIVFNHPTVDDIAKHLAEDVFGLAAKAAKKRAPKAASAEPIAIIGMSCRFPGGADRPEAYWDLIAKGLSAITTTPNDRWDVASTFDPDQSAVGKMYSQRGGFLGDVTGFDPQFFGISPREAMALDPQHRLLLELSWEALERAGIEPSSLQGSRTGVFIGITTREYLELVYQSQERTELESFIPTGTSLNTSAGRLSYFLNLRGPSMAVDTACSSSLVAIHLACQSIRSGESEMALVGGVNLMLTPSFSVSLCASHAISPTGRCATFDASADGYVRSEGAGMVLLKPLSAAQADGDHIHAVILGSAVNQDGRSSGLTAPNGKAQEDLIEDALHSAGLMPADVGYVETHGTGTPLGDPIEMQALGSVLKRGRQADNPLILGAVKTNIGHTESAAGIAGLIKAAMVVERGMIPGNLNLSEVNPHLALDRIPAVPATRLAEWKPKSGRKIAGVSSFGFSGTNSHVIIAEPPASSVSHKEGRRPAFYLLCLSAQSEAALKQMAAKYADLLAGASDDQLADICYTAFVARARFNHRLAITAPSLELMRKRMAQYLELGRGVGIATGKVNKAALKKGVAFLFSGQGSQYFQMGKALYESQPVFRQAIDECQREIEGIDLLDLMYHSDGDRIHRTEFAQPAIFAIEYALAHLWKSWGVEAMAAAGHSIGELAAACIAGVFDLKTALQVVSARSRLMQAVPGEGTMIAVRASESDVKALIGANAKVSIAALNGPTNLVVSGFKKDVDAIAAALKAKGIHCKALTVSHGFHSPQMEPMLTEFARSLSGLRFKSPTLPLTSNVTGGWVKNEMSGPDYWPKQVRGAVRFAENVAHLWEAGHRVFLEIGSSSTLTSLAPDCIGEGDGVFLHSLKKGQPDLETLFECAGRLFSSGIELNWQGIDQDYSARSRVQVPTYPFQRSRYWVTVMAAQPGATVVTPTATNAAPPMPQSKRDELDRMSDSSRKAFLESYIDSELRRILRIDSQAEKLSDRNFSELGLDSVMTLELQRSLRLLLGEDLKLSPALLYERPTCEELASYLAATIWNAGAAAVPTKVATLATNPIRALEARPGADTRVIVFPFAGGSAEAFISFNQAAPSRFEVHALQLGGRGLRFHEAFPASIRAIVDELVEPLMKLMDRPTVFLGYSMGGLIAFETIKRLETLGKNLPTLFVTAGTQAPWRNVQFARSHSLADSAFLSEMKAYGLPTDAFGTAEELPSSLKAIKADLHLVSDYVATRAEKIHVPIIALAGREDRVSPVESVQEWSNATAATFELKTVPGTHGQVLEQHAKLIQLIQLQVPAPHATQNELLKSGT